MEKIQVIQPTKLLAPYIKQYWFLLNQDYEKLSGKLNQTNAIVNRRAYGKNEKVL